MPQESGPFIVLSPQPELFPRGGTLAPRLDTLRGKTIAFLDNNKLQPRNRYFDLLGELLKEREMRRGECTQAGKFDDRLDPVLEQHRQYDHVLRHCLE